MKRKQLVLLLCILVVVVFLLIGIFGSLQVEVTTCTVCAPNLPQSFNGFCIVQISDLHNTEFGPHNEQLLSLIRTAKPDMIVVTGDLIDSYRTKPDVSLSFMEEAVKIAPCYYVCGNHELRMPNEYASLKKSMQKYGVIVLEDRSLLLQNGNEHIQLMGLVDRSKLSAKQLPELIDPNLYTILLSHRPEHFSAYEQFGADLVFSGHAHGGQIRLPIIGALFAPGEGFFPKYADGLHTVGNTTLVVSRGLGNSSFPFRFYCPPELVVLRLMCK